MLYSQGWAVKQQRACDQASKVLNCVVAKGLIDF